MSKRKDEGLPMLPMFPRDFIAATLGWTLEQRGLYLMLMFAEWELGSLPSDNETLANIAGVALPDFARVWKKVGTKFITDDNGHLVNLKLEEHRAKSLKLKAVRSQAGKQGGKAKANNKANRPSKSVAKSYPPSLSPSPSLDPSPSPKKTGGDVAKAPSTSRGTRLPKDFVMTPERSAYAVKHGLDPSRVYGMFTTYWWGKAGAGATKLDWDATWQHWCMKDAEKNVIRPNFMNQPGSRAKTIAELEAEGHADELTRTR